MKLYFFQNLTLLLEENYGIQFITYCTGCSTVFENPSHNLFWGHTRANNFANNCPIYKILSTFQREKPIPQTMHQFKSLFQPTQA